MENKPKPGASPQGKKKAPQKKAPEKKGSNKGILVFFILLSIGSAIGLILLFIKVGKLNDTITAQKAQITECQADNDSKAQHIQDKDSELETILNRYKSIKEEREKLGKDNAELEAKIATVEAMVKKYKNAYFKSNKEKKQYEAMITDFKNEIAKMEADIQKLTFENDSLKTENSGLQTNYDELSETNDYNETELEKARKLKAKKLSITVLNEKGKEYDKGTYKAKIIDQVKVKVTLEENEVAIQDSKESMLRIIEPGGSVLFDLNNEGGSFEKADGKQDFYTSKINFGFKNTGQTLTFLYKKGSEFSEGTYKVEVYCEGHLIGKSAFVVK